MATKIKTRDRILKTALDLFNAEGEAEVSTVDIAAVLDISPGNLYYHFKGKDAIIEGLFDNFEEEIHQVLSAPIAQPLAIEDNWIYVYIIFEEIHDFRFFYNAIPSILDRCPALRSRFRRVISLKQKMVEATLGNLAGEGILHFNDGDLAPLTERLALQMTYWVQFCALKTRDQVQADLIHEGVYAVLSQITPYLGPNRRAYHALLHEFFLSRTT